MNSFQDLSGKRFGRFLVICRADNKNGRVMFKCKCNCGGKLTTYSRTLRNKETRSCGCLHLEQSKRNLPSNTRPVGSERIHDGYVEVKLSTGIWRRRHIVELEKYLGRSLEPGEIGHHCDRNKKNDKLSNIELMLHGEHTALHHTGLKRSSSTRKKISAALRGKQRKERHRSWRHDITRESISHAVETTTNIREACVLLGIAKRTLYNRINYYREVSRNDQ